MNSSPMGWGIADIYILVSGHILVLCLPLLAHAHTRKRHTFTHTHSLSVSVSVSVSLSHSLSHTHTHMYVCMYVHAVTYIFLPASQRSSCNFFFFFLKWRREMAQRHWQCWDWVDLGCASLSYSSRLATRFEPLFFVIALIQIYLSISLLHRGKFQHIYAA
jgi:hypothetical protein